MPNTPSPSNSRLPWPGRQGWAAVVCGLQGLALLIVAAVSAIDRSDTVAADLALVICLVVMGGALLAIAWSLLQQRAWARGPALTFQIIALAIAVIEARLTTAYGWLIGVPALVAFIILVRGNQTQEDSSDS